ncbi:MAG: hypothetical protein BAJALOKI2v1_730021 [Promethearchaeota archaeon]|nr:MAG: hypothetical protein BAJALOKI2v1_730021 [Candidatus Lokiarchaeota archaeon]
MSSPGRDILVSITSVLAYTVVPTPFASGDKVAVPPDSRKRQYLLYAKRFKISEETFP